ncbi:hypothetical protein PoB_006109200 [Plakobranchus ocellatus]|uniref:Uncharacterized protein n=1 Tax=Plakobranchus ocellatus TaxID=259542 RepID=A0AAV4CRR7_9GAST|nr:hypothetical protein PoB_006109200 [Plakobranchus ocellatus]
MVYEDDADQEEGEATSYFGEQKALTFTYRLKTRNQIASSRVLLLNSKAADRWFNFRPPAEWLPGRGKGRSKCDWSESNIEFRGRDGAGVRN